MLRIIQSCLLIVTMFIYGLAHAATIQPGDLLISEVMANPASVSDLNGEWFELFNTSASSIDINGLTISDNGNNSHQISNGGSLHIAPGAYLVLGRNGDITNNGGYVADYVYTNFTLNNTIDQIVISNSNTDIVRLNYSGLPFGANGVSAELVNQLINPNETHYQLSQNNQYGLGDIGSPGSQGSFELVSASTIPIPGTVWLFASAILMFSRKFRLARQECHPI
ncbi:MAG: lamin tail domain-containing protein [Gammaproteobacteria bacterium]